MNWGSRRTQGARFRRWRGLLSASPVGGRHWVHRPNSWQEHLWEEENEDLEGMTGASGGFSLSEHIDGIAAGWPEGDIARWIVYGILDVCKT